MRALAAAALIVLFPASAWAQTHASKAAATPIVAPPPDPTPAQRASNLLEGGNDAMIARRYADALDDYQKALALTPGDVGIYYSIARADQFIGDYPAALDALETFEAKAAPETKAKVGKLADLYAEIRPRVSTLDLKCSEVGARVLVRDRVVGATPLATTRLPAGASTVQLELDGFFTETRDVVLPGGGTLKLEVTMHRKSTSAMLGVSSNPIGSFVSVDGKDVGTTSPRLELTLTAGAHDLLVRHEGYDDAKLPLVLAPGATRDVDVPLDKSRSIVTRWWFWTGVGAVIAGGVVLTYALTTEKGAGHGSLAPGQVGGP